MPRNRYLEDNPSRWPRAIPGAPQARKLISQRAVGPTNRMFDTGTPSLPMGGFNQGVPSRPGFTPTPPGLSPQFGRKDEKKFDWNSLAYVLGGIGQAAMGPHQDRWQAKLGGQVQKLSQGQAYQKAIARALSGARLDPSEFTILSPEQRTEVSRLSMEGERVKIQRQQARDTHELAVKRLELSDADTQRRMDEFDKEFGLKEEKFGLEKEREPLEKAKTEAGTAETKKRTEWYEERIKVMRAEVDEGANLEGSMTPEDIKLYGPVLKDIKAEAWRQAKEVYPDEADSETMIIEYLNLQVRLAQEAVRDKKLPPNWIPTSKGVIEVIQSEKPSLPTYNKDWADK